MQKYLQHHQQHSKDGSHLQKTEVHGRWLVVCRGVQLATVWGYIHYNAPWSKDKLEK